MIETYQHIRSVQRYLNQIIINLLRRAQEHDTSKLQSPEAEVFEKYTPLLRDSTYGSEEYKAFLTEMKPALDHHYSHNSHHPEFHQDGIRGMSLIDLVEMICDWKAASERHANGDVRRSIEINQKRFGYSDELKQIFLNTVESLKP